MTIFPNFVESISTTDFFAHFAIRSIKAISFLYSIWTISLPEKFGKVRGVPVLNCVITVLSACQFRVHYNQIIFRNLPLLQTIYNILHEVDCLKNPDSICSTRKQQIKA